MFAVHGAKQGRVITEEQGSVLEHWQCVWKGILSPGLSEKDWEIRFSWWSEGHKEQKIAITFDNATTNLISSVDYHSNCTPLTKGVRIVKTKPVTWI